MTTGFLYLQPAHSTYSVGEYDASGTWMPVVDGEYTDRRAAQDRVDELNAERKAAA